MAAVVVVVRSSGDRSLHVPGPGLGLGLSPGSSPGSDGHSSPGTDGHSSSSPGGDSDPGPDPGATISGSSPGGDGDGDGDGRRTRYRECMRAARQRARAGELRAALALVAEAEELCPGQRRAARLRAALEEAGAGQEEDGEDEDDEWAPVPGCSLRLYRPLLERLLPHQRLGVAFLHRLFTERRGGGILADDMGLGKTVQLLAFLSGMFDAGLVAHCLVIMPASLLATWLAEFTAWTPGIRVKAFHGSKAERSRNLLRVQRKGGVVITTYQLIIYNLEELSQLDGHRFDWDYVVLDEAHKIKGHLSKTTKHVNALPAKNRVLLTGTPVQNNLQEMWSLFDFACQGSLLGPLKDFKLLYEAPITRAREKDTSPAEKALGLRISESLMDLIQPYFLRRTKEGVQKPEEGGERPPETESDTPDLLALSRKSDLIVWVHLSGVQEEIYRKFVSSDIIQELLQTKQSPLVQLNNLKKLCDHPRLLSKRLWEELELGGEYDVSRVPADQLVGESGKLLFLLGLLEKLREEGHCTLVFSQSRRMLDIIQRVLAARGFRLARMDGTVALADRQKVVEEFQRSGGSGCSVFLLTTQVGGVGLTLTAANRVVVVDPSWNPATDAQAVDRAYRIGQTADVIIYRLVTCGTVEEKIYRRQIFKDSLIRQSVGERKNPMRYFSRQELRELFVLEDPMRSSTQLQLHSMHGSPRQAGPGHRQHLAFLRSLPMFGVTDHGLVHARDGAPDEDEEGGDGLSDPASQRYIQERVRLAQDLVAAGTLAARQPGTLPPPSPPAARGRGAGRTIPYVDYRVTQTPEDPIQVPSDGEEEDGEAPDLSCVGEGEVEVPAPGLRDEPAVMDLTEGPDDGETEESNGSCVDEPASPEVMEREDGVHDLSCRMAELGPLSGVIGESPSPPVLAPPPPTASSPGRALCPQASTGPGAEWLWESLPAERDEGSDSLPVRSPLHSDFQLVLEDTMEEEGGPGEPGGGSDSDASSGEEVIGRARRRAAVMSSDEEEGEGGSPAQSPASLHIPPHHHLSAPPTASTPRASLPPHPQTPGTPNCSYASRRSLVRSLLEETEDEEEDDDDEGEEEDYTEESSEEGGPGTAENGPHDTRNEGEMETESETDRSGTFDAELGSSEKMEPFTRAPLPRGWGEAERVRGLRGGGLADPRPRDRPQGPLPRQSPSPRGQGGLDDSRTPETGRRLHVGAEGERKGPVSPVVETGDLGEGTPALEETPERGTGAPVEEGPVEQGTGAPVVEGSTQQGTGAPVVEGPVERGTGAPVVEGPVERGTGAPVVEGPVERGTGAPVVEGSTQQGTGPSEGYDSLVRQGKELMGRGELRAALGCLLKALDLNSGDPGLQLTTIQLYRQLDQS